MGDPRTTRSLDRSNTAMAPSMAISFAGKAAPPITFGMTPAVVHPLAHVSAELFIALCHPLCGHPVQLLQRLLSFRQKELPDLELALKESGCTTPDLVAAYMHNQRLLQVDMQSEEGSESSVYLHPPCVESDIIMDKCRQLLEAVIQVGAPKCRCKKIKQAAAAAATPGQERHGQLQLASLAALAATAACDHLPTCRRLSADSEFAVMSESSCGSMSAAGVAASHRSEHNSDIWSELDSKDNTNDVEGGGTADVDAAEAERRMLVAWQGPSALKDLEYLQSYNRAIMHKARMATNPGADAVVQAGRQTRLPPAPISQTGELIHSDSSAANQSVISKVYGSAKAVMGPPRAARPPTAPVVYPSTETQRPTVSYIPITQTQGRRLSAPPLTAQPMRDGPKSASQFEMLDLQDLHAQQSSLTSVPSSGTARDGALSFTFSSVNSNTSSGMTRESGFSSSQYAQWSPHTSSDHAAAVYGQDAAKVGATQGIQMLHMTSETGQDGMSVIPVHLMPNRAAQGTKPSLFIQAAPANTKPQLTTVGHGVNAYLPYANPNNASRAFYPLMNGTALPAQLAPSHKQAINQHQHLSSKDATSMTGFTGGMINDATFSIAGANVNQHSHQTLSASQSVWPSVSNSQEFLASSSAAMHAMLNVQLPAASHSHTGTFSLGESLELLAMHEQLASQAHGLLPLHFST